jgi:hypothetical protein
MKKRKLLFLYTTAIMLLLSVTVMAQSEMNGWGSFVKVQSNAELTSAMYDNSVEEILLLPGYYAMLDLKVDYGVESRIFKAQPSRTECTYFINVISQCFEDGSIKITAGATHPDPAVDCEVANGSWWIENEPDQTNFPATIGEWPLFVPITPSLVPAGHPYLIQLIPKRTGYYKLSYAWVSGVIVEGSFFYSGSWTSRITVGNKTILLYSSKIK